MPRRGGGPSGSERPEDAGEGGPRIGELAPEQVAELSTVFLAARWLRDLGFASWLLSGVPALLVGLVWLAGQASTIIQPVRVGMTLAAPLTSAAVHVAAEPRLAAAAAGEPAAAEPGSAPA